MSSAIPKLVGANSERSKNNEERVDQTVKRQNSIEDRLDRLERSVIAAIGLLAPGTAQSLGVPTQDLFSFLLSLL